MAQKVPNFTCPKCGSEVWDNRETKRNPRSPDWGCSNKSCGTMKDNRFQRTGGWFTKPNAPPAQRTTAPPPAPLPPPAPKGNPTWADLDSMAQHCLSMARRHWGQDAEPEVVRAWAAGLLATAVKDWRLRPIVATGAEFSQMPEALDDDDLPFN